MSRSAVSTQSRLANLINMDCRAAQQPIGYRPVSDIRCLTGVKLDSAWLLPFPGTTRAPRCGSAIA